MKKLLTLTLTIVLIVMSWTPAFADSGTDDITGHYFENDMRDLIELGILGGYAPGVYKPDKNVTRAEFAAFVVRALKLPDAPTSSEVKSFTDVPQGHMFYNDIRKASFAKIVNGTSETTFDPTKQITREEMAAMISNAIESQGVNVDDGPLTFTDADKIQDWAKKSVARLVNIKIISGNTDNTFTPKAPTTRGVTAAILNRMLKFLNPTEKPEETLPYAVATVSAEGTTVVKTFETYTEAKQNASSNQVVLNENGEVVWMNDGIAVADFVTATIYPTTKFSGTNLTYVNKGTEMKYIDSGDNWVKVTLNDTTGYVKKDDILLIPTVLQKGRSYYSVTSDGYLAHSIYTPQKNSYASYQYGPAPEFLIAGQKYYSWNGYDYYDAQGNNVGQAYQYFEYLPVNTQSPYTAEELNNYVRQVKPESPLVNLGSAFKKAESDYGINAMFLMAVAIHESGYGLSSIAQRTKNLFSIGAYDTDPAGSADTYSSFEESIDKAAKFLKSQYNNPADWKYNGFMLGNKTAGMNVRYASDPYWGQKIAGYMYRIDLRLGSKEFAKYQLGAILADSLNVRSAPSTTNSKILYEYPRASAAVIIQEAIQVGGDTWYKIISEQSDFRNFVDAYVFGTGSYGNLVKVMPIAR